MEIVASVKTGCLYQVKKLFRFWNPKKLNLIPEKSQVSSKVIWISSVIMKYKYVVGNMFEFSSNVSLEPVCLLSAYQMARHQPDSDLWGTHGGCIPRGL